MTDDAKKPREWWLPLPTLIINSDKNRPEGIHVIEYSAYQKLEQELREMHFAYAKAKTELYKAKAEVARWKKEDERKKQTPESDDDKFDTTVEG